MAKWTGLEKPITATDAEAEHDQLFDRPLRPIGRELAALFAQVDGRKKIVLTGTTPYAATPIRKIRKNAP